jgi:hypothetical protein
MQITQVIAFLAVAIVGAVAAPGHQPPEHHNPPAHPAAPTTVVQQVFYMVAACFATQF